MSKIARQTIYSLTLNPALDLSGTVNSLVPDEKNYVHHERRDPGGNGINAARIVRRLGGRVQALGFLGGATGDEILALLKGEGITARFDRINGHTRVNVTVTNQKTGQQTRLTFPGPLVRASEQAMLLKHIQGLRGPGLLILGGSIPPGCKEDFHLRIARKAIESGLGLIVDVPSRYLSPLFASHAIRPLLIKPNQVELEGILGETLETDAEVAKAACRLTEDAELVCVSLAERGAILAWKQNAWFIAAPRVQARGTVGAGDSMVGAMATQLLRSGLVSIESVATRMRTGSGQELPTEFEEMLRWGVAAGAATAEVAGTSLARPKEIRRLLRQVPRANLLA